MEMKIVAERRKIFRVIDSMNIKFGKYKFKYKCLCRNKRKKDRNMVIFEGYDYNLKVFVNKSLRDITNGLMCKDA